MGVDRGKGGQLPEGGWDIEALLLENENPDCQEKRKLPGRNYLFRPEEEHKLLSSLSKHINILYPTQKEVSHRLIG